MKCLDHEVIVSLFQFMQTRRKSVNLCLVGFVRTVLKSTTLVKSHFTIWIPIFSFMERFHCFDYYSSPILEGCFCFALHINGYTDSLLGAPTVILNKMTCGYISNEWATPFFSTQFCYWAAVHLVPVNCLLSILNNMKLAEYELKLIFVITHGAKYPKQPVYRNKWLVDEMAGLLRIHS